MTLMFKKMLTDRKRTILTVTLMSSTILMFSHAGYAADTTVASLDSSRGPIETVVVTGSRFNPDVAPAKACLLYTSDAADE